MQDQRKNYYIYLIHLSYLLVRNAIVTQLVECNLAKVKAKGSNPFSCWYLLNYFFGWMAERFKAIVLKTVVFNRYRGFESHSVLFKAK